MASRFNVRVSTSWLSNFYIVTPNEAGKLVPNPAFKKYISFISDQPLLQVVEYVGDETAFVPSAHGNAKDKSTEFVRTAPSTMKTIRETVSSIGVAETYRSMVVQNATGQT